MSDQDLTGPVVVGIDGSDAAIKAAEWAAKEAVHHDVPLRLVYVIRITGGLTDSADAYPAEENFAASSLRAARLAVQATGLPVKVETAVLCEDVDSALIAESKTATLVCIGSVGVGRVANTVLGSTATTLAERAYCPVAIIRRFADGPVPESGFVAVVVDDQPDNHEVMQWAMEEARVRRAPVLALRVGSCWGHFEMGNERFHRRLEAWRRRYPDIAVEVASTRLSLARYLESYLGAVQLVVIGSRDVHWVPQLLGSECLPIFAHADCSVLVVRDN